MSLFKPSAKKVVETIFSEFTPEEMKILESPDCAIPYMYTTLLNHVCPFYKSKYYFLTKSKDIAKIYIYSFRDFLNDPRLQGKIFFNLIHLLLEKSRKSSITLEPAVNFMFDFIKCHTFLDISNLKKDFLSYLSQNHKYPFIDNKEVFFKQIKFVISTWPKGTVLDYFFVESELKDFFISTPVSFSIKYQPIFTFMTLVTSIFIPIIIAVVQTFISNK